MYGLGISLGHSSSPEVGTITGSSKQQRAIELGRPVCMLPAQKVPLQSNLVLELNKVTFLLVRKQYQKDMI